VIFSNTELFKIQALEFLKTGTYNTDPYGSPAWIEFWTKELEYCKNGYSVGDVKITGDHYFYLNYCQIKRTDDERVREKTNKSKKWADKGKPSFPDFWDGDYDYFWAKEIARKGISLEDYKKLGLSIKIKEEHLSGGKHLIVAKARRKGFSYKNAAIAVNNYNSNKTSLTVIGAYEKKFLYPKGTMSMASDYMDFLNEHTGWSKKRDFVNKTEHKKASYKFTDAQGNIIEKGYKSEIIAVTFMDNPDAARGKDSNLILMEEAGAFSNLKASFAAVDPLTKSGSLRTGQILVFGTGGDMEAGTLDFEDMFYDPDAYNMLAFENQWDDNFGKTFCGFYFPDKKNKDGFIDKNGNSDEAGAEAYEEIQRENLRRNAKDKKALDRYIVEYSNKPKETFLRIKGNIFPTIELQRVLGTLEAAKDENNYWIGDLLSDENGKIEWKPNKNLRPILEFPIKDKTADTTGAVIIYEPPFEGAEGAEGVPYGMYIASCDPYDHDKSQSGSLGSTLIYNRLTKRIVAEYTARPETSKEYYEVVRKLLIYYNAKCLYENEKKGIFDYFDYQNCTYLLADQPECIKDVIQKSTVQRGKGLHMNKELKDYGEGLIKTDLIEAYDERNPELKNMHKIRSQPLLKELIAYDGEINTDRVMAYMLLMYYKLELRKYKVDTQTEIKEIKDSDFFNANHYQRRKRNFR
jgi:hypothetical protein